MIGLRTLARRAAQFGLRRSIAIYLIIVVALVLASELAIEHLLTQGSIGPVSPLLNALAIAAVVGVFVFFLFHGAVEGREHAGIALRESEERFRSLTSLSADWFWETDAENRLGWISGGQQVLKLFGAEFAYGRRFWEIPGIVVYGTTLDVHLADLAARRPFHDLELRRPGKTGGGSEYHLISGEPRQDASGRFIGYRGVGRDITEIKCTEQALSGAKARLELALDSGGLAIWDSHVASGRIYLSGSWTKILGEPVAEQRCLLREVTERVHADDLESAVLASRRAAKGEIPFFSAEIRVRTSAGNWEWVVTSGRVVERDAGGRALRMTGTVVSIDARKRAEHALRDAEARYRSLVDVSPDGVLLQSEGRIEYANRAAAGILGVGNPAMLFGRNVLEMIHADDAEALLVRTRYLQAGPGVSSFRECRMLRQDGSEITCEIAGVSYLERGRLVVQTVLRDITERVRSREALAEREQRFRDVVEAAGEYVWETDAEFRYTWLSARIESVLGYPHLDLLGRRPQEFMPLGEARAVEARLASLARRAEPFRDLIHRSITRSGRAIWQSISGVPVLDAGGNLKGYRGTGADITSRKLAEERIQYLATRDPHTGLPNRLLLADRAEQAILNAGRKSGRVAVLSVQLDRFSLVTDLIGRRVGDALLRAVAERLSNLLRKDDTLARLEGEKYVFLWDGTREVEDVALVAKKILNALGTPIYIEGRALSAPASIGIGVYPGDGVTFDDLLRSAESAGFAASEAGGNTYRYYSPELNARAVERLEMENDLHRAFLRGEFVLYFQPIVSSGKPLQPSGDATRIVGAEVLLCWQHPGRGLIASEEFLSVARQAGLMERLSEWMIDQLCERVAGWQAGPAAGLWFAINASARDLSSMRRLSEILGEALIRHDLDGSKFVLEVGGRGVERSAGGHHTALRAVADLGVALAIEDFGTGQADLVALRQLPVSKVKIDRRLVAEIDVREDAAIIVRTIASMARSLGLECVASGVENEAQLACLHAVGCDEWRGLLFSAPLDGGAFEALLQSCARRTAFG